MKQTTKIAGIIAEYNPFHNGHKHQIDRIKNSFDGIVALMSGSFVQRGDIAVCDKFTRTKAALICGCDLVLELPVYYSLSSAQNFASGAVGLLDKTNVIDSLVFGAETDSAEELIRAAEILENEPADVSGRLSELLSSGLSYPAARSAAYEGIIGKDLLTSPNNILATEYIRALIRLKSSITPCPIPRAGVGHDAAAGESNFASASYIRSLIYEEKDISEYVPECICELYRSADMSYRIRRINSLIIGDLRKSAPYMLRAVPDISEGLENRIIAAAGDCSSFEELCDTVKTKRYTMSRIRRAVLAAVLGFKVGMPDADYIRVLGMNGRGAEILREIKQKSNLKIITKLAGHDGESELLKLDILASDIFALCSERSENHRAGRDFTTSPIVIR